MRPLTTASKRLREQVTLHVTRRAQDEARMVELIEELHRSEQARFVLETMVAGQEKELRELKARLAVYEAKAVR